MKKIVLALILLVFAARPVFASSPHLVVNFAQVNDLDWGVAEEQWQTEIKPKVTEQIKVMRATLDPRVSEDDKPVLAWSTLMEYMNFPMDTPSDTSVYAVKMRRILDLAEELDFPVFVPLNGYQWWDQLPELYNWWDDDGTKTDPKFFARQKNPEEFKSRFIAGYDPENVANVEWQSQKTPMKLNYRNWGGGGFRLAPPPNLLSRQFQKIQQDRLRVILREIQVKRDEWRVEQKEHLFVGLSIGTEISLNASVTPADEFKPYGYGSIQSYKIQNPNSKSMSNDQIRTEVLRQYLETMSQFVHRSGVPKSLIYTHVFGEADPNDPHYAPYADSSFNLYSNPGSSFYGYKDDPLASTQWQQMIEKYDVPVWGALEYSDTPTAAGLITTLQSATIANIYNWDSVKNNTSAVGAIRSALSATVSMTPCSMDHGSVLHIQSGLTARIGNPEILVATLSALPHGIYSWFTESACADGTKIYSEPRIHYAPLAVPTDTTPRWVRFVIDQIDSK